MTNYDIALKRMNLICKILNRTAYKPKHKTYLVLTKELAKLKMSTLNILANPVK